MNFYLQKIKKEISLCGNRNVARTNQQIELCYSQKEIFSLEILFLLSQLFGFEFKKLSSKKNVSVCVLL